MPISVTCACGKKYTFKDKFAGRRAKCPACGAIIAVPGQPVVQPSQAVQQAPPPQVAVPTEVCPHCRALLKRNPYIISRMQVRCPFCGTRVNPTLVAGFFARITTLLSLAFRSSREPEYRLFTLRFTIFIVIYCAVMIAGLLAMISDYTEQYYSNDPSGAWGAGIMVAMFFVLFGIALPLYASAVAVKLGHNRWAWFLSNYLTVGVPLLVLICFGGFLRPLEPDELFPQAKANPSGSMEFRATNRWVMWVYYPLSFLLCGLGFVWFWPPLTYSGCPTIEYRGYRLRCRWNRTYWLPGSDGANEIAIYLPLLSFGGRHFWKACRGLAQVLPGTRRITYRAPGIWWVAPGVAVE